MGEEEEEDRGGEVVDDGAAIDQALGEVAEMFTGRNVMKERRGREPVAVDDGDVTEEVMNEEEAHCDYSCNDLAGGER